MRQMQHCSRAATVKNLSIGSGLTGGCLVTDIQRCRIGILASVAASAAGDFTLQVPVQRQDQSYLISSAHIEAASYISTAMSKAGYRNHDKEACTSGRRSLNIMYSKAQGAKRRNMQEG